MNLHTFDELDDLACKMLEGEIGPITIASLKPTERLTALELTFAMALCKLGVLSPKASGAFKLKIYQENKQFAVEFNHLYTFYRRWIDDTRDTSVLRSSYDKAMLAGNEHIALELASKIIDKLTGENVHYKLYEQYCTDEDCRTKTVQAAAEVLDNIGDDYDSRLPYSTIVDSLFRFYKPEKMVKLWEQLGVDCHDLMRTSVPIKCSDTKWAVDMVDEIYGNRKNKKLSDVQEKQSLPECKQDVPVQSV